MSAAQLDSTEILPLVVRLRPVVEMTNEQFFQFCQLNRDLRIERTAKGELIFMSPTGSGSGYRNAKLIFQLATWAEQDSKGIYFDSSAGFTLSNGAVRSPDAAWIKKESWEKISAEEREKFAPICPDFVVELESPTDSVKLLQEKMQEYIDNGAALGWLIDPKEKKIYIYCPQADVQVLNNPATISGDPVLPGFVLNLSKIW